MNELHREWWRKALQWRRRATSKPTDAEILAEADALMQEARRLGIKAPRDTDLGWERRRL